MGFDDHGLGIDEVRSRTYRFSWIVIVNLDPTEGSK